MTMGVFDFKSIGRKLNRLEQKAEFEEKNPKPAPVVWTPEWGYGTVGGWLAPHDGRAQNQYQIHAASNIFGNYNK